MHYAHDKGLGIIVMEPLRGGALTDASRVPDDIMELWNKCETKRTPAEWALNYVWDKEEVGVVLSGMSTMEQVEQNIKTASTAKANSLTDSEKKQLSKLLRFIRTE